jgi:hypothetical protein
MRFVWFAHFSIFSISISFWGSKHATTISWLILHPSCHVCFFSTSLDEPGRGVVGDLFYLFCGFVLFFYRRSLFIISKLWLQLGWKLDRVWIHIFCFDFSRLTTWQYHEIDGNLSFVICSERRPASIAFHSAFQEPTPRSLYSGTNSMIFWKGVGSRSWRQIREVNDPLYIESKTIDPTLCFHWHCTWFGSSVEHSGPHTHTHTHTH